MNRVNTRLMAIGLGFIIVVVSYGGQAVSQLEIENLLQTKMNAIREQRPEPTSNAKIAEKYGVKLLPYLEQYRKDASDRVRWQAYALLWFLGKDSDDPELRQDIVHKLVEGMNDESPVRRVVPLRWLFSFKAKDFSDASKALIHEMLMVKDPTRDARDAILLAGVADMKFELPLLKKLIVEDELRPTKNRYLYGTISWAALKARARMGVQEDINRCIELVESHPDEEERVVSLLKNISYVRQPQVVEYLWGYLNSEKKLPPWQPGPDARPIPMPYAPRAAEALAQMLPDFPLREYKGKEYTYKGMIERYREWMLEQKEWEIIR